MLALPLLFAACVTSPALVPAGGAARGSASAAGAALTVFHAPWESSPYDLADYVTPIAVEFFNGTGAPLRISYADLVLSDENGRRYAAIDPYPPETEESAPSAALEGRLVASAGRLRGVHVGAPPPAARRPAQRGYGAAARVVRGSVVVPYGLGGHVVIGGGFHGYAPYPSHRPWLGEGIDYWGGPCLLPPGYASWVWSWSPVYYPSPAAPSDVLALGLPEGVLSPGGRVSGYLYFQHAALGAHHFVLAWEAHDANTGAELGRAPVALSTER